MALRALRGATTVDADVPSQITERVQVLLTTLLARNGVTHDDLVSIVLTATEDVVSLFPAQPARSLGLGDVPLLCARELAVVNGTPRCIRVLVHCESALPRAALHHVYLEGAKGLRDDLPD